MKINTPRLLVSFLCILIGAAINNILWYFRLKNPILMREFVMYFEKDGARVFLDFNGMNYFFIMIWLIVIGFYILLNNKKKQLNMKQRSKHVKS